jgi:hypothetical protein
MPATPARVAQRGMARESKSRCCGSALERWRARRARPDSFRRADVGKSRMERHSSQNHYERRHRQYAFLSFCTERKVGMLTVSK